MLLSFKRLVRNTDGAVALTFSVVVPVLLLVTALAVDSASLSNQASKIQSVADATALAVAKELHLLANEKAAEAAGVARAEALLVEAGLSGRPYSVDVQIDRRDNRVRVNVDLVGDSFLPAKASGQESPIKASSEAQSYGQVRLCVLGLNRRSSDTILAQNGAVLTAPDCAIQSNSSDSNGMVVKNLSSFISFFTCTSGGYSGSLTSFLPPPKTDCPALADPLSDRQPPDASSCDPDKKNIKISGGSKELTPGTYCGGITLTNKARVTAAPGVYVIKGGKLEVGNQASLKGDHVSFYFADDAATFVFKDQSVIELGAPKDGAQAGILFFENRSAAPGRSFEVSSTNARKLLGTIYLPRGTFKTGGSGTIGSISAYTVIVADRIDMTSAKLVINADYAASDVPVPSGLGAASGQIRLIH